MYREFHFAAQQMKHSLHCGAPNIPSGFTTGVTIFSVYGPLVGRRLTWNWCHLLLIVTKGSTTQETSQDVTPCFKNKTECGHFKPVSRTPYI